MHSFLYMNANNGMGRRMSIDNRELIQQSFGQRVRETRETLGLSQEALALRAGLHRTQVSLTESGKRMPRLDTVVKLVAGLNTSYDQLLGGVGWRPVTTTPGEFISPGEANVT